MPVWMIYVFDCRLDACLYDGLDDRRDIGADDRFVDKMVV